MPPSPGHGVQLTFLEGSYVTLIQVVAEVSEVVLKHSPWDRQEEVGGGTGTPARIHHRLGQRGLSRARGHLPMNLMAASFRLLWGLFR